MKIVWKEILASVALSAVALSMIGTDGAAARNKSDTIKPNPPTVEKGKSATMPQELPTSATETERGIKDKGVRSCGNCGLTGREAAPPPVDDGAAPPSADYEEKGKGQHLIRDKPQPSSAAKRKGPKVRDDSVSTRSSLLPVLGGVAALAALAAAVSSGGDDSPTSP